MEVISVSAANIIPLSGYYPYNDNIKLKKTKVMWKDGYVGYQHNILKNCVDYSINKDTLFCLTTSNKLFDCIVSEQKEDLYTGAYVNITHTVAGSTHYIMVSGDALMLSPLSSDNSLFRYIVNENNSFSLLNGSNKYITAEQIAPHRLLMQAELPANAKERQEFYNFEYNDKWFITVKINNIFDIGPEHYERFWSHGQVDQYNRVLRTTGFIPFGDYINVVNENDYIFDLNLNHSLSMTLSGFTREHSYVDYYNEIYDKENNSNVNVKNISAISVNHLIDIPYNNKININEGSVAINFANLKSFMTSDYDYTI